MRILLFLIIHSLYHEGYSVSGLLKTTIAV